MKITRQSILTKETHTLEVPCTEAQLKAFQEGARIQDAMPDVSPDMREFVLTGITPEEWNAAFKEDE